MTDRPDKSDPLAVPFDALKSRPARPDGPLLARILDDAAQVQADRAAVARPRNAASGRMAAAIRAIGGWPALGGLATATLAGIWIGIDPPSGLAVAAQTVLGGGDAYLIDVDPYSTLMLAEGAL